MVEAWVLLDNGDTFMEYADEFIELFAELEEMAEHIRRIECRTITLSEMRQGKYERRN